MNNKKQKTLQSLLSFLGNSTSSQMFLVSVGFQRNEKGTELLQKPGPPLRGDRSPKPPANPPVTQNATHTTRCSNTSEELTSSGSLWRRLLNAKPNTKINAWTWCDWDFGLCHCLPGNLGRMNTNTLLNWKGTQRVRCGKIRHDGVVWYWLLYRLMWGQEQC